LATRTWKSRWEPFHHLVELVLQSGQLSIASGSLKQLLEIPYDEQLESETTAPDDIEGMIYKFIPPDYTKSSFAFDELIEADAVRFKPLGEKVGSYARPTAKYLASFNPGKGKKGKGKGKGNGQGVKAESMELKEDSEDAVVYEMYKVG